MSTIKDSELAVEGNAEVNWAQRQMQVLEEIKIDFENRKPLEGLNIGACMHVTKETANLMLTLQSAGANVALCASNPLSTKDSVAAYLDECGIEVHAIHGVSNEEFLFTHSFACSHFAINHSALVWSSTCIIITDEHVTLLVLVRRVQ